MRGRSVIAACLVLVTMGVALPSTFAQQAPGPEAAGLDAFHREWLETLERLSQSKDPRLAANKRLALRFLYGLILVSEGKADVSDVATKYLAEGYIQHDPNIPTGRDGFIRWFKAGGMVPNTPTAPKVDLKRIELPRMVLALAEGDLVTTLSSHPWPDPSDSSKTYEQFHVGIFRVRDGLIVEHWNEAMKGAYWCRLSMCESKH